MNEVKWRITLHQEASGSLPSKDEIVQSLKPRHRFQDGWDNDLVYSRNGGYVLIAPGSDGEINHEPEEYRELANRRKADRELYAIDSRGDFDVDMVIVDGEWVVAGGKR